MECIPWTCRTGKVRGILERHWKHLVHAKPCLKLYCWLATGSDKLEHREESQALENSEPHHICLQSQSTASRLVWGLHLVLLAPIFIYLCLSVFCISDTPLVLCASLETFRIEALLAIVANIFL